MFWILFFLRLLNSLMSDQMMWNNWKSLGPATDGKLLEVTVGQIRRICSCVNLDWYLLQISCCVADEDREEEEEEEEEGSEHTDPVVSGKIRPNSSERSLKGDKHCSPTTNKRHDSPDASSPRRIRHDSPDASPPRKTRHDSPDASPPRQHSGKQRKAQSKGGWGK